MMRQHFRSLTAVVVTLMLAVVSVTGPGGTVYAAAASGSGTASASKQTVRVGMPDTDTKTVSGYDNGSVAYMKDYLQAVAEYADWDYVYVKGTWSELVKELKTGKIDLLMDVTKTQERLGYFNYSSESMGTEMCYLIGPENTSISYNDFKAFNGMKVGYEQGSTIINSLSEYGREKGFTVDGRAYKSGAVMFAALDKGEIDAVVQTNFYEAPADHVVLAKCDPTPVYIVTSKKRPQLKQELDEAMTQLFSYNPSFNADMYELHLGQALKKTVGYTKKERAYLKTRPTVNVYYEKDWAPFEYDDNGRAEGMTPDIIRALGKKRAYVSGLCCLHRLSLCITTSTALTMMPSWL